MERRAHVAAASAAALLAADAAGLRGPLALVSLAGGLLGARLPDLDLRRGHRVVLHNVFALAAWSLAAFLAGRLLGLGWPFALGLAAGYGSHLLLDALTVSGVALLYPLSRRRLRLLGIRGSSRVVNLAVELLGYLVVAAEAARLTGL